MTQQEKWVALFEQVVGRKPSPQEFKTGKESNFDFKQIKTIANMASPAQTSPQEPVYDVTDQAQPSPQPVAQPVVAPPVHQEATGQALTGVVYPAPPRKPAMSKAKKRKIIFGSLAAVLVLGLGAGYVYLSSITGPEVAKEAFIESLASKDYSKVAQQLSTKTEKWTAEEAEAFVTYLTDKGIKWENDLSESDYQLGTNKILALKESGKLLGIFPEYAVTTYPLTVKVKTNMDKVEVAGKTLEKDKETDLGSYKIIGQTLPVTAKTDLGEGETQISLDLEKADKNNLNLTLNSSKKKLVAKLPAEVNGASEIKLFVNDKEVATELSKELNLMASQELTIHASFKYEGTSYQTEKKVVTVAEDGASIDVSLDLAEADLTAVTDAKQAKEAAAAQKAKEEEEAKAKIPGFLASYRSAMFESIRNRTNNFASYMDSSLPYYQQMEDYTLRGGANSAKVDYHIAGALDVRSITKEGDVYVVQTYEDFTQVFYSGSRSTARKNKTYRLKPTGDSFLIVGYDESNV